MMSLTTIECRSSYEIIYNKLVLLCGQRVEPAVIFLCSSFCSVNVCASIETEGRRESVMTKHA